MDTNLLRSWLGLPPGDWPPEPRDLLGTQHGAQDSVEDHAVALMEKLRPHQLKHPELVTEGMNRLAQALLTLEAETRRRSPESTLQDAVPLSETVPGLSGVLEAEVIAVPELVTAKVRKRRRRKAIANDLPVSLPEIVVAPPLSLPSDRRSSYRRLVTYRELLLNWRRLGPYFGVPSQNLNASNEICRFLEAVVGSRTVLLRAERFGLKQGTLSRSILSRQSILSVFRELQRSQRETLAADWALCLAQWQGEEKALRESLRVTRPRRTWRQRWTTTRRWLENHPEWILSFTIASSSCIALIRWAR